MIKEDAKALKIGREESSVNVEPEKTKASTTTITPVEVEAESKKPSVGKERNIDLQLDLEKTDTRDGGAVGVSGNRLHQHILPHRHQQQQQQQQHQQQQQTNNEKTRTFEIPSSSSCFSSYLSFLPNWVFALLLILILLLLLFKLNLVLYLCQFLCLAGLVGFLTWGTVGKILLCFLLILGWLLENRCVSGKMTCVVLSRYMAPLQGVVSMDGTAVSSAAIQVCIFFLV